MLAERLAKDKAGASIDIVEQGGEKSANITEEHLPRSGLEDEQGEKKLQSHAGCYQAAIYFAAVSAHGEG